MHILLVLPICWYRETMLLQCFQPTRYVKWVDTMPEYLTTLYHLTLQSAYVQMYCSMHALVCS